METIAIRNPSEDYQTALYEFEYVHASCPTTANGMKWSREHINDVVSLTCTCGLVVSFPQSGPASSVIAQVSFDGSSRELPNGSFDSSPKQPIVISAAVG